MSLLAASNDQKKTQRLKVVIASLFLLSAMVFGTTFYLQKRADKAFNSQNAQRFVIVQNPSEDVDIAQAKNLRNKWRSWALKHQELLSRMLQAQPNDQFAFKAVWDVIPPWSNENDGGITDADLNLKQAPYSWNAVDKIIQPGREDRPATPKELEEDAADKKYIQEKLQKDFAEERDIKISESVNTGPSNFSLWASGRITKSKLIPQKIPGQPSFLEGSEQEIVPSYDFLK